MANGSLRRGLPPFVAPPGPSCLGALELPYHVAAHVKAEPPMSALVFDLVFHLGAGDLLIARGAQAARAVPGFDLCRRHHWQSPVLDQLVDPLP